MIQGSSVGYSSFPRKRESRGSKISAAAPCSSRGQALDPAFALGHAHIVAIWSGRGNGLSLSALGGGEGRGEVGDSGPSPAHLTFPRLRRGPLPLPPEGRRGIPHRPGCVHALV